MRRACSLLVVWSLLRSVPALATEDPQGEAQALFERGLKFSTDGRWADAHAAFLESARLTPRASTYFNLAVSSLELGLGRSALDALEQFDTVADPATHADYAGRAAELRLQAQQRVGTLELSIAPADARFEIDGTVEPVPGTTCVVLLDPGVHVARVSAEGYQPRSIEVTIAARDTSHQRVELTPLPTVSAPALQVAPHAVTPAARPAFEARPAARDTPPPSLWSQPLTWVVVGAVIAASATTALVVVANDDDPEPYRGSTDFTF